MDTLMSEIRRNIMIVREANNGMDALMSAPIRIKETNYRLLFGLISLSVCVDDFCPSSDDSEIKYKTQINLRIFSFTLRFKGWSSNPPTVIVNNVDDNYAIRYMLRLGTAETKWYGKDIKTNGGKD